MAVWTVKGGSRDEREDLLVEQGLIGGSWGPLTSLEGASDVAQVAEAFAAAYPDMAAKSRSSYVGQLWSLRHRMQVGELVVMPLKTTGTIAVGRITGPYQYRGDLGETLQHVRPVAWQRVDVARDAFDQDLLYSFGAFLTFGRVRREGAEARILAGGGALGMSSPRLAGHLHEVDATASLPRRQLSAPRRSIQGGRDVDVVRRSGPARSSSPARPPAGRPQEEARADGAGKALLPAASRSHLSICPRISRPAGRVGSRRPGRCCP